MSLRKKLRVVLITSLLVFSLPSVAIGEEDSCQSFNYHGNNITIPVIIQGKEYPATLTTSNIGSTITQQLVAELNLKEKQNPKLRVLSVFGKEKPYRYVSNVALTLFGNATKAKEMAIVDGSTAKISLSLRLFDGVIIQLNFPESKLCLYPRDAIDLRATQNVKLDSDAKSGSPIVRVTLNDSIKTWLAVSLVYDGALLVDPFIAKQLELDPETEEASNNYSEALSAEIDELTFGPYRLGNVAVEFPKAGEKHNLRTRSTKKTGTNIRSGHGSRGRLGLEILQHFIVTMDLELERMHVFAP